MPGTCLKVCVWCGGCGCKPIIVFSLVQAEQYLCPLWNLGYGMLVQSSLVYEKGLDRLQNLKFEYQNKIIDPFYSIISQWNALI